MGNNTLSKKIKRFDVTTITDEQLKQVYARIGSLLDETRQHQSNTKEMLSKGFLGRVADSITGQTSGVLGKSMDLQGQVGEATVALCILNLKLAQGLKSQAEVLERQQIRLMAADEKISGQQEEIKESAEKLKAQQETILSLLQLTEEQEVTIRRVVRDTDYIRNLEKEIDKRVDQLSQGLSRSNEGLMEMSSRIKDLGTSFSNDIEKVRSDGVKCVESRAKLIEDSIKEAVCDESRASQVGLDAHAAEVAQMIERLQLNQNADLAYLRRRCSRKDLIIGAIGLLALILSICALAI